MVLLTAGVEDTRQRPVLTNVAQGVDVKVVLHPFNVLDLHNAEHMFHRIGVYPVGHVIHPQIFEAKTPDDAKALGHRHPQPEGGGAAHGHTGHCHPFAALSGALGMISTV